MSDFDDFDDLDAVRDFRSTSAVLTAETDARIRRGIIELAIARGLVDRRRLAGTTFPSEVDREAQPLSVGGDHGARSSPVEPERLDSPALLIEQRPTNRWPRGIVREVVTAAAVLAVIVMVAASALFIRRTGTTDVHVTDPAAGSTTAVPSTTANAVDSIDSLTRLVLALPDQPLDGGAKLVTMDEIGITTDRGNEHGFLTYTRQETRSASEPETPSVRDALFLPRGGVRRPDPDFKLPETTADALFASMSYADVRGLPTTKDELRSRLTELAQPAEDIEDTVVATELALLRLPVTPPAVRSTLIGVLVDQVGLRLDTATVRPDEAAFVGDRGVDQVHLSVRAATGEFVSWSRTTTTDGTAYSLVATSTERLDG